VAIFVFNFSRLEIHMTINSTSTLADIQSAKTADLLAFYNAYRTSIKKFRDRTTAEARCSELLKDLNLHTQRTASPAPEPVALVIKSLNPKTYLGIVRDHSGSMSNIAKAALRDYNNTLAATQAAATQHGIKTIASIVRCGGGWQVETLHTDVQRLQPLTSYPVPGHNTPLFSSVNELIDRFKQVPDFNDPEVTFVILATTDGQNNAGMRGTDLAAEIKRLNATDRWTFAFRVPKGDARGLVSLGIDAGNILEWDQTERGMAAASQANEAAMSDFYANRAAGVKSTKTFYTSAANLTEAEVKAVLGDISGEVQLFPVAAKEDGIQIRDFVENRLNGAAMAKGAAFYQLVKTEDKIQDYKLVAIRDKDTGAVYCGAEARDLIGLPRVGDVRVRPDTAGKFHVFIQSTSVNRKVNAGTQLMYWPNVGVAFKEGKSAR
jgi:hypothetical protein